MFRMHIDTQNAAFEDELMESAVIHILQNIVNKLTVGKRSGSIMDVNGNTVGYWELLEE